jgi:hypothetical protein
VHGVVAAVPLVRREQQAHGIAPLRRGHALAR